jgi:hypothetical protein
MCHILKPQEDTALSRIILCMKWGTLYNAGYVNVLYNAVKEHLKGPFRFVCLTDDSTGFLPTIEALPIPELPLRPRDWTSGAWPKLGVFTPDLHGLEGRALFIDLDSVVVGDLSPMFEHPGRLILLDGGENWRRGAAGDAPPMPATGVFAFTLGTLGHIVDTFRHDPVSYVDRLKLEQAFVGEMVPDAQYWPSEWVPSFKRHLRQPVILDRFLPPRMPATGCKIVAFHGDPRPITLTQRGNWAKFPRYGAGPVGWVADYWQRNGGTISR